MKETENEFFKYVLLPIIVVLCVIMAHGFYMQSVKAHIPATVQRIREDDGLIVWKFQDSVSDCYITTTKWYHNSSTTSPGISCVKR